MDRKLLNTLLIGAAAGVAMSLLVPKRRFSFDGKSVLITGGSRGLGLVLARKLVDQGARVAICARSSDDLQRAEGDLIVRGGDVVTIQGDIRIQEDAERFVGQCLARHGALDVLINNAGVIQVGPLEEQTEQDFRDAMDTHFWGPFYMMQAALPLMKRNGGGRIANIVSIGGKVAVPHLAPYCASKFALAGMSSAYNGELAKDGISVTTIYPGLMRTGSHVNALFKGQNEKEYAMFSAMDGTALTSMNVERAASKILDAIATGRSELILSIQAKAAAKFAALFPESMSAALQTTARILPGEGGIGTNLATGLESRSSLVPDIVTGAIDEAARLNNELKPGEVLM